jgi:flagellar biosynthetic protein FliO
MQAGGFLDYLGILIVFCAILFLAWLTTRLIGKRLGGDVRSRRMQVVETLPLGMDRSLMLVRVGQKHYLLATGRGRTDFMAEVDPGPESEAAAAAPQDFRTVLERYSGLGRQRERTGTTGEDAEATGLQAGIQRLRRMNGSGDGENHPHG